MRIRVLPALALATLVTLTGCGAGGGGSRPNEEVTLLLDFTPNAVHSGIYSAVARGFDDAEGVPIEIEEPGESSEGVKLLAAEKVDVAILDIHDLAIAREKGVDLVGIQAIVQRPLAAVIADDSIASPKDLAGKRVGVTGLPSDVAVLRSIVTGAGGDPDDPRSVEIGFNAVASLASGKVDAVTAFWNVEGVALKAQKPGVREFRVDDFGAPAYPELVLCATRRMVEEEPDTVAALRAAIARGYQTTGNDPEGSVSDLVDAVDGLDRVALQTQLDAVIPAFTAGAKEFGELSEQRLKDWARWEKKFGITREEPDVARAFTLTP